MNGVLGLPVQTKWFPEFFGISCDKESAGGRGMIYSIPLNGVGHHKMCWKPAKSMGFFSARVLSCFDPF